MTGEARKRGGDVAHSDGGLQAELKAALMSRAKSEGMGDLPEWWFDSFAGAVSENVVRPLLDAITAEKDEWAAHYRDQTDSYSAALDRVEKAEAQVAAIHRRAHRADRPGEGAGRCLRRLGRRPRLGVLIVATSARPTPRRAGGDRVSALTEKQRCRADCPLGNFAYKDRGWVVRCKHGAIFMVWRSYIPWDRRFDGHGNFTRLSRFWTPRKYQRALADLDGAS